jgi:bifunctional DNA-binding transcriptional regulator/antitoxin component of YhaV-PrlF toxin-antitoxin module
LEKGQVIIPQKVARGIGITPGDTVVLVATNRDGSVNGMQFTVAGLIEDILGPSGKDAYMHIDDARSLLRTGKGEVTEIVVRQAAMDGLDRTAGQLAKALGQFKNPKGKPAFEIHTWADLSPFANIASMIDLLIITVKIVMIAIVLISVLNVMLMSVFERIREIGTIAAMGTPPGKILALFVREGFSLGLLGRRPASLSASPGCLRLSRSRQLLVRPHGQPAPAPGNHITNWQSSPPWFWRPRPWPPCSPRGRRAAWSLWTRWGTSKSKEKCHAYRKNALHGTVRCDPFPPSGPGRGRDPASRTGGPQSGSGQLRDVPQADQHRAGRLETRIHPVYG